MRDLLLTAERAKSMAERPALPDSKTHRLAFFPGAPAGGKWIAVDNFIADEVEDYREFVKFLFPKGGQNLFKLYPPDTLEPRWSIWDKDTRSTYCYGNTPLEAVRTARSRLAHERNPQPILNGT